MRRIARGHTAFPEHIGASFIIWHHFRSVVLVSHRPKLLLIPQDKWPALWRAGTGGLQHMVASLYRRRSMNEGSPMRRPTDLIIEPAAEHNDAASPCPDLHEPNDREAWAVSPSIFWISGGRALSRGRKGPLDRAADEDGVSAHSRDDPYRGHRGALSPSASVAHADRPYLRGLRPDLHHRGAAWCR